MTDLIPDDLSTLDDDEIENLNRRLSARREEIREAQMAIAAELDRRADAERTRRAEIAAAQQRHPHAQTVETDGIESAEAFDDAE